MSYQFHGLTHHPQYNTWKQMKQRCLNSNHPQWKDYGGRGITICDEWLNDFSQYLMDVGIKPSPNHSLDRINNDDGYSPDNCKWVTKKEQQNNRRNYKNSRIVTINNREYSLQEISQEFGINLKTLESRWEKGLRDESILKRQKLGRRKCN